MANSRGLGAQHGALRHARRACNVFEAACSLSRTHTHTHQLAWHSRSRSWRLL